MAANKMPSALCWLLLNLPSDSLVDAAAPAPVVVGTTRVLASVAVALAVKTPVVTAVVAAP